jgi:hypothetical protein
MLDANHGREAMSKTKPIGRLAMRQEGNNWNAYYAMTLSMDGAVPLGSIAMAAVVNHPDRKRAFLDLMREVVADIIEEATGTRPIWGGEEPAPEHERAGNA